MMASKQPLLPTKSLLLKEPKPILSEEEFIRFGVTTTLGSLTRLQNSGHIKIR